MVDATKAMESQYLTAATVEESPTKTLVILDGGKYEEVEFNGKTSSRLTLNVVIDKKEKTWRPNKDSCKNISRVLKTKDTKEWVGQPIKLEVISIGGKDSIVAQPITN